MSHVFSGATESPHWEILCDNPDCFSCLCGHGTTDTEQRRSATELAESEGWHVGHHGGLDLCRECLDARVLPPPVLRVTDLYGADGVALVKGGRR